MTTEHLLYDWFEQSDPAHFIKCCGGSLPAIIACRHALHFECDCIIVPRKINKLLGCPKCRSLMPNVDLKDVAAICIGCATHLIDHAAAMGLPVWVEDRDGQCELLQSQPINR